MWPLLAYWLAASRCQPRQRCWSDRLGWVRWLTLNNRRQSIRPKPDSRPRLQGRDINTWQSCSRLLSPPSPFSHAHIRTHHEPDSSPPGLAQWACHKKASAYGSRVGWTPARRNIWSIDNEKHWDSAYLYQGTSYPDLEPYPYLYPDRHQKLIVRSLVHCQPSLKISRKSVWKFLRKVSNKQTNRRTMTITYPPPRRWQTVILDKNRKPACWAPTSIWKTCSTFTSQLFMSVPDGLHYVHNLLFYLDVFAQICTWQMAQCKFSPRLYRSDIWLLQVVLPFL